MCSCTSFQKLAFVKATTISRFDNSASGIGFDLNYIKVTSTWNGRVDMSCAHAQ